jgi:NAD(P)-dependent dehydrogenase (short-subunit alcohol dehydrogenase family)
MARALRDQVVVITGASSGIGRAAAFRFAREGASVVLAARGLEALESAALEVERLGGTALPVQTDVANWSAVQALTEQAVRSFSRIDTWINNAAVSEYATVEHTQPEEFERIIQVNLLGQIFGSRSALLQMKHQDGGCIINVASVLAFRSVPLQAAYSASKHGVKGFTEALRLEMKREYSNIDVCLVMPSSMNTPLFAHARSKVGAMPMPIPPIYQPEVVAETLVWLAARPQAEVVVGGSGKLLTIMQRISPGLVDWYMLERDRGTRQQLSRQPDDGVDNLDSPIQEAGSTHGDYGQDVRPVSVYTRSLEQHPLRKGLALGATVAGLGLVLRRIAR